MTNYDMLRYVRTPAGVEGGEAVARARTQRTAARRSEATEPRVSELEVSDYRTTTDNEGGR